MTWPRNDIELSDEDRTALMEELRRRCRALIAAGIERIPADGYAIALYGHIDPRDRYTISLMTGYLSQDIVYDDTSLTWPPLINVRLAFEKVLPVLRKRMVLDDLSDV